ncbi:MAG: peroxiredoxin, partial [Mycobacteriales bacterium]
TYGCTRESCHFRDLAGEFATLGAQVVGISADEVPKQAQFRERHQLGFPLLSDPDKKVAGLFGVRRAGPLPNKRATFVIGPDRRVLATVASEVNFARHADEALAALRR